MAASRTPPTLVSLGGHPIPLPRPKARFFRIFVFNHCCGRLAVLLMLLSASLLFLSNPRTIIFILVLFFGAKRIPELFRGVGQGVREFKDASNPEPQQPANPNGYPQQPGYNQAGYPQPGQHPQQPTAYNPNGYTQQYGQVPPAPHNPNNTPAS